MSIALVIATALAAAAAVGGAEWLSARRGDALALNAGAFNAGANRRGV